jgi:phosphatidylglycerol---prolipoprotein diacylglyceryl transferase
VHFPINIHLGSAIIPVHFVCEALAYTLGYRYYTYLRRHRHDPIDDNQRILIFIGAAVGAFVGSHVLGVLENPDRSGQMSVAYFMGNTTIIGGLLGGLIGVELMKKRIGVMVSSGDLMVYPIALSMIIGRAGCFLAGLTDGTYGIPTSLPWAVNFGDGIPRHPTNLYEMLFWLILWIGLTTFEKRYRYTDGARFKIMMTAYLLFRFFIEFIKPAYFFNFGLSVLQLASIAGLLYYYKVIIYPSKLINTHA